MKDHYEFKDINDDGNTFDPSDKTISVFEILKQHKVRYIWHTENAGDIVLKHMHLSTRRKIDMMIYSLYPGYIEADKRLKDIGNEININDMDNLPKDLQDEITELAQKVFWPRHLYLLGIISTPMIGCLDDIEALYDLLTPEEAIFLDTIQGPLEGTIAFNTIDSIALDIADRFKVTLVDRDMLENMTVAQADYFTHVINKETDEALKLLKRNDK